MSHKVSSDSIYDNDQPLKLCARPPKKLTTPAPRHKEVARIDGSLAKRQQLIVRCSVGHVAIIGPQERVPHGVRTSIPDVSVSVIVGRRRYGALDLGAMAV
jgi:hypothetical protein